jgi:hypothetical protein
LDEAIASFRTVLSLAPTAVYTYEPIGEMLIQKGDAKAALAEIQQEPDEKYRLVGFSMAYHALDQHAESETALAELIKKYEKTMAFHIAAVQAFRQDANRAFEWLNKAVQNHDPMLGATAAYPMLANIRADPRWLPFLRRIGMALEQLAAIKFDVTVPN